MSGQQLILCECAVSQVMPLSLANIETE